MVRYKSYKLKKRNIFLRQKSLIYIRRCARLPIHSSTQTRSKTTQLTIPLYQVFRQETHLFSGKMILRVSKQALQLGGLTTWIFFSIFMAEPQLERVEKRQKSQCFKIVQINLALGKINANACANKSLLKVSSQSFDSIVLSKMFLNLSVNAASICDLTKPCKVF